jgi:hypothetical protein
MAGFLVKCAEIVLFCNKMIEFDTGQWQFSFFGTANLIRDRHKPRACNKLGRSYANVSGQRHNYPSQSGLARALFSNIIFSQNITHPFVHSVGVVHAAGVALVVGFVRAAGVGRAAEVGREAGAVHAAGVGARRNLSAQRRSSAGVIRAVGVWRAAGSGRCVGRYYRDGSRQTKMEGSSWSTWSRRK